MSHHHHEVCFWRHGPLWVRASLLTRFLDHTTTHHRPQDSSGRVISSSQRPLRDNTQHSQQTDINAPDGIRTHNLSRRTAADLRLRTRGHWGQHPYEVRRINTRSSNCYKTEWPGAAIPTAGLLGEVLAILTTILIVMSAVGLSIGMVMTMITMMWMIISVIERRPLRMV